VNGQALRRTDGAPRTIGPMLSRAMAATATVVALAFTLALAERWLARRRAHERAWTVSMAMFTVASGALLWGVGVGWSPLAFRCFYLFGAILNVPWLALGTVELLAGPRCGRPLRRGLALGSAFALGVMLEAPLRAPVPASGLPTGKELFGPAPRLLAGVASGVAALVVIGGALWSAWRLWRGRARSTVALADAARPAVAPGRLALGNVVIAVGTLILGASGTLNGRLGASTAFAVTLAIGVVVLFAGFVVATSASTTRRPAIAAWLADALAA
jgi:hypothetical protein